MRHCDNNIASIGIFVQFVKNSNESSVPFRKNAKCQLCVVSRLRKTLLFHICDVFIIAMETSLLTPVFYWISLIIRIR